MKDKKALSTVVVALILLVVAVLLANVLTMFATNITSTRTQQEDLRLSNEAIWVYTNDTGVAALTIDNIGGRDVAIDRIEVRGSPADWSTVYCLRRSTPVLMGVTTSLNCPPFSGHTWTDFEYTSGSYGDFSTDSYDKPLASGDTPVIHIQRPNHVGLRDIAPMAHPIEITIFTPNRQYCVECNARSAHRA